MYLPLKYEFLGRFIWPRIRRYLSTADVLLKIVCCDLIAFMHVQYPRICLGDIWGHVMRLETFTFYILEIAEHCVSVGSSLEGSSVF